MARVRRGTRTLVIDVPNEQATAQPAAQSVEQADTSGELGDGPTGKQPRADVSRVLENGKRAYLCEITLENVTQRFFQAQFGGGVYHVTKWVRAPKGSDRQLVRGGEVELVVDPRIPAKLPSWLEVAAPAQPNPPAPAARSTEGGDDPMMRNLLQTQIVEMIKDSNEMRAQAANGQQALLASVMKMIETSAQSTAALIGSITKGNGSDGGKQVLETLALFDRLRPAVAPAGAAAVPDQFTQFDRFLAMMRKMQGSDIELPGGDREDEGGGMLAEAARTLLPAIVGAMKQQPAAPQPAAAPPGAPAAPRPTIAASPAPEVDPMESLLSGAVQSLYERAQDGDDPGTSGLALYDMCPKMFRGKLREAVMDPNAIETLIAAAPAFAEYRQWLSEALDAIRKEFTPPDAAPADVTKN